MIYSIVNRMFCQTLVLIAALAVGTSVTVSTIEAAEFVQVIHGPGAAPLEKLAASELADILGRVFDDVETRNGSVVARRAGSILFVGNSDTNPGIAREFPNWPKVSDQGIVTLSNGDKKLYAVGGGSPAATLWAVYELGHRLGIRYLLRGDIDPLSKRPFDLSGVEGTIEPQVPQRGWETLGSGAHSFESWGLADHQRVIRQLAKMKFNHLILKLEPWHPFVSYAFKEVTRSTATFWNGRQYKLTGDVVGKKAFGGATHFRHPEFEAADTPPLMFAAGGKFLTALIDTAREYGMTVSVQFHRYMHAPEFAKVLPEPSMAGEGFLGCFSRAYSFGGAAIVPMPEKLLATEMKACFDAFPGVDSICWPVPWVGRFTVTSATDRRTAPNQIPPLNEDQLGKLVLKVIPAPSKDSRLSLAIHSPTLDMLPQTHAQQVERTLRDAIKAGWSSVSVGPSTVNEFSQDVHYVSRAMWDVNLSPAESHKDLWATTTGNESASDRLWIGRQHLEKASSLILANDADLVKLGPGMLIKRHYIAEPIPDWWQEATDAYTQYMIELYRAQGAVDGDAKPVLFYYAKRGEFVLEYLGAIKAVREAALAKKAGDTEMALEHLELALESTYNCINTLSDVARNQGDRGLIAVLNAFAYRPLVAELERLSEDE